MSRSMDRFRLDGRVAVITGSGSGMGRAIALALADAGAAVMVHGVSLDEGLASLADEIASRNAHADHAAAPSGFAAIDLADRDAAARLHAAALEAVGKPDIVVHAAATQTKHAEGLLDRDLFEREMGINLASGFELAQACIPAMVEQRWGRLVFIGSVQEMRPSTNLISYAMSKGGQATAVRMLARKHAGDGITVNNLAPGFIETPRTADDLADPEKRERAHRIIPAGFVANADDVVGSALLLCSDAGRYITGQTIRVDGGLSLTL